MPLSQKNQSTKSPRKKTEKKTAKNKNRQIECLPTFALQDLIIITDDLCIVDPDSAIPLSIANVFSEVGLLDRNQDYLTPVYTPQLQIVGLRDLFKDLLSRYKNIVYLASSSHLTDSYNLAELAIESFHEDKSRVLIIDTKVFSAGVLVVKDYVLDLLKEGYYFNELQSKIQEYTQNTISKHYTKYRKWYLDKLTKLIVSHKRNKVISKISKRGTIPHLLDDVKEHEEAHKIRRIYITYSHDVLKDEAELIKNYLERSMRYFNQVSVLKEVRGLKGYEKKLSLGVHIG